MAKEKGSALVGVLLTLLLLAVLAIGFLLLDRKDKNLPAENEVIETITSTPTPYPTKEPEPKLAEFTHPVLGYSLSYKTDWIKDDQEAAKKPYEEFFITSPDYTISEGYPVLEKGASIRIAVKDTQENTIDKAFNAHPIASKIAQNKTETVIDGVKALQYEYSYEGTDATVTEFIYQDKIYTLTYRYTDEQTRSLNWEKYETVLSTFKFK